MSRPEDDLEAFLRALEDGTLPDQSGLDPDPARAQVEPLLGVATRARSIGDVQMPVDARRRIRSTVLQRAAELRESRAKPRALFVPRLRRVAVTLGLVGVLAFSSTGFVRASSAAVPGDQLYPVKRSWEGIRLRLSPDPELQYSLASEFEQERLDEIWELLGRGREAPVAFSGIVRSKVDLEWSVSGIPVVVPAALQLPAEPILEGQPVLIAGQTRNDGKVVAQLVQLLRPGAALPPLAPSEDEKDEAFEEEAEGGGRAEGDESSELELFPGSATYTYTGIVERLGAVHWRINRQQVRVDKAVIIGSITVGTEIDFEGYYAASGEFVATRIQATSNLRYDDGRELGAGADSHDSEHQGDSGKEQEEEHHDEPADEPEDDGSDD